MLDGNIVSVLQRYLLLRLETHPYAEVYGCCRTLFWIFGIENKMNFGFSMGGKSFGGQYTVCRCIYTNRSRVLCVRIVVTDSYGKSELLFCVVRLMDLFTCGIFWQLKPNTNTLIRIRLHSHATLQAHDNENNKRNEDWIAFAFLFCPFISLSKFGLDFIWISSYLINSVSIRI